MSASHTDRVDGETVDRRQKALAYVDLKGRGLEIGPSYDPLVPKSSGARIETVDHASRTELIEKYRGHDVSAEKIASIEEVDHIWMRGSLVDLIGEPGGFDYIVASHMIEHTVDMIGFLQDCEALLREGGRLALVIPDKRYCFDRFQPLTSAGGVVDGHQSGSRFHPLGSVIDHYAYGVQRGPGVIAWDSATTTPVALRYPDLRSCSEVFEQARRQEDYIDIHRWRFTPTSFRLLLGDLRELGYHGLAEVGSFDTDGFEFFITLARTKVPPAADDRLTMLHRIEQELCSAVESVVPAAELHRCEEAAAEQVERLRAASAAELRRSAEVSAAEVERLRVALSECEATLNGVLSSKSWRITGPLRAFSQVLRRNSR